MSSADSSTAEEAFQKGEELYNARKYQEALPFFEQAIVDNPNYVQGYKGKGNVLLQQRQYEKAIRLYEKAIELDPLYADAYINIGVVLYHQEHLEQAIEYMDKAISIDPGNKKACFDKGLALRHQGKLKEAIQAYNEALSRNPCDPEVYRSKCMIIADMGGDFKEDIEAFGAAIAMDPDNYNAYYCKGLAHDYEDEVEEANSCFDKAIQINPENPLAYAAKGDLLKSYCRYNEAIECFDNLIQIKLPHCADACYNKAVCLYNLESFPQALEWTEKAIQMEPENAPEFVLKGMILHKQGNYKQAIDCFDVAIQIHSCCGRAYVYKGRVLADQENYAEAFQCFDDAIRLNPGDATAYYYKGTVLSMNNQHEEAVECFDKVVQTIPSDDEAYSKKAVALWNRGKFKEAVECFDKALAISGAHPLYHTLKAVMLSQLQDVTGAADAFRRAVNQNKVINVKKVSRPRVHKCLATVWDDILPKFFKIARWKCETLRDLTVTECKREVDNIIREFGKLLREEKVRMDDGFRTSELVSRLDQVFEYIIIRDSIASTVDEHDTTEYCERLEAIVCGDSERHAYAKTFEGTFIMCLMEDFILESQDATHNPPSSALQNTADVFSRVNEILDGCLNNIEKAEKIVDSFFPPHFRGIAKISIRSTDWSFTKSQELRERNLHFLSTVMPNMQLIVRRLSLELAARNDLYEWKAFEASNSELIGELQQAIEQSHGEIPSTFDGQSVTANGIGRRRALFDAVCLLVKCLSGEVGFHGTRSAILTDILSVFGHKLRVRNVDGESNVNSELLQAKEAEIQQLRRKVARLEHEQQTNQHSGQQQTCWMQ